MANSSLAGWTRTFVTDGLLFTPPAGARAGSIRLRTQLAPMMSADAMLALVKAQTPPLYQIASVEPPRRATTMDGEYAVFLEAVAKVRDQHAILRVVAMILGDRSYDMIDAASTVPDEFPATRELVETLVYSYSLGLGDKRRRRYFYRSPEGWSGIARPRATLWIPPTYPKTRTSITVFDARPATLTPSAVQDRALWEDMSGAFTQDERKPTFDMVNPFGLSARVMEHSGHYPNGERVTVQNVALYDERTVYFVRLESSEEDLRPYRNALGRIIETVEPLPVPLQTSSLVRWAAHWAE